jgi:hypothetical protein
VVAADRAAPLQARGIQPERLMPSITAAGALALAWRVLLQMVLLRISMLKVVLVMGVVAGCEVGEVGGADGGNSAGEASFTAMIAPLVTECVTGGCHTVQPPILTSFSSLAAKYTAKPGATNILVTKGSLTGDMHSGLPYLTAEEQTIVANWIDSL